MREISSHSIPEWRFWTAPPLPGFSTAVAFARERDLLLAVKCGGHSFSGKSTCEGGMQLDLSSFRHVRVDAKSRAAASSVRSITNACRGISWCRPVPCRIRE